VASVLLSPPRDINDTTIANKLVRPRQFRFAFETSIQVPFRRNGVFSKSRVHKTIDRDVKSSVREYPNTSEVGQLWKYNDYTYTCGVSMWKDLQRTDRTYAYYADRRIGVDETPMLCIMWYPNFARIEHVSVLVWQKRKKRRVFKRKFLTQSPGLTNVFPKISSTYKNTVYI